MDEGKNFDISDFKIIVLEDSYFMASLLTSMLTSLGVKNLKVTDNKKEFEFEFSDFKPDIILTDWKLRGFTGSHVAKFVRENKNKNQRFTPIIVISGYTDKARIKKMLATGVDDVIVKPVSTQQLYFRICKLISTPVDYIEGPDFFGPKRNLQIVKSEDE